jgi:rhodanese-related sulfurtransferase
MPLVEALERRDRGEAVLVDVRSPQAYADGHVPGALSIPSSEIEERAAEIRKMGRLPILYCG